MSALPLQRPTRNRWRRSLTHEQYRLIRHFGYVDPKRIELGRAAIGAASRCYRFGECFGDPTAVLRQMHHRTALIIKFPERRSELAKLRTEIAEMKRTVRGGCC